MMEYLMKRRIARSRARCGKISAADIDAAGKILFVVMSRYGDSIFSFNIINKFIQRHPGKQYQVITTNQLFPYAARLITGKASITGFNKRRNPLKFLQIISTLKRENFDLGFNPRSGGYDSEFLTTYAQKFMLFNWYAAEVVKFTPDYNIYDRIRDYLSLPREPRVKPAWNLERVQRIVISPFSTSAAKSLGKDDLAQLLEQVRELCPEAEIIIALQKEERRLVPGQEKTFLFQKSRAASESFLKLLEAADLVISVDAGPLHLADALGLRTIGLFGPTPPQTILDSATNILPIRDRSLDGVFCSVACQDPKCLHNLWRGGFLQHQQPDYAGITQVRRETARCRAGHSA